eukprot:jgi/Mesvir1/27944/Mv20155-RA.1
MDDGRWTMDERPGRRRSRPGGVGAGRPLQGRDGGKSHPLHGNAARQQMHEDELAAVKVAIASGSKRVALLKEISAISARSFTKHVDSLGLDTTKRAQIQRVVLESNMSGIEENSELFYELLDYKEQRFSRSRDLICATLADAELGPTSGFDEWERTLIVGATRISQAYGPYYTAWMRAASHPSVLAAVADSASDGPSLRNRDACTHLLSAYTMIRVRKAESGYEFNCEPYAVFFEAVLQPVLDAFDACISTLSSLQKVPQGHGDEPAAMLAFLKEYRNAMAERDVEKLEAQWEATDRKWMDCRGPIQIVHDIETGYSDPLRVKQGPDFSVRFLDEQYAAANTTIASIQGLLEEFFRGRPTPLSRAGLRALSHTMAGIYYSPYHAGCSLVFTFSGQSVPNRQAVKEDKGVKIYFNVDETRARIEIIKNKVRQLFADGETSVLDRYQPDAIDHLVWHVAAHEVGHAIYHLRSRGPHFSDASKMLLEEPRAELTATYAMLLLYRKGTLSLEDVTKYLIHMLLDGLRYFSKWDSQPMQPYIAFAIHAHNTYHKHGMLRFNEEKKLVIEERHALAVLEDFEGTFIKILDSCDLEDEPAGKALAEILVQMRQPSEFVREVVPLCKS